MKPRPNGRPEVDGLAKSESLLSKDGLRWIEESSLLDFSMLTAFPGGARGGGHRSQNGTEGAPKSGAGCGRAGGALHAPSLHRGALAAEPRAQGLLPLGPLPAPRSWPAGPGGLCGAARLSARSRTIPGNQLARVTQSLWGGCNLISLPRASARLRPHWPLHARQKGTGIQAPWAHLSQPSPAPALSPTTWPALRLLSVRDFAELPPALGCPGARRTVPRDPPQLQPLGFPCEIPAPTRDSEIAWSPLPGPSAPPPALHSTNGREAFPAPLGSHPLPNDTLSLMGLAFCCVPKQVRREPSLNVKGSAAEG